MLIEGDNISSQVVFRLPYLLQHAALLDLIDDLKGVFREGNHIIQTIGNHLIVVLVLSFPNAKVWISMRWNKSPSSNLIRAMGVKCCSG